MKIVVVGGSGLIGSRLVENLRGLGHEVLSASPRSGVNAVTGAGLAEALQGANVVVDVSNSPSFADEPVMEFFRASTTNLLAAEKAAGVGHHVALSVVGAERLPDSGYMRAKVAQEALIKASPMPYTILRATQFFEFLEAIGDGSAVGEEIHVPTARLQPVAAEDVSAALTEIALDAPANRMIELGGPEALPLDELVRRRFAPKHDPRPVVGLAEARYFGAKIDDRSLTPAADSRIGKTSLAEWLSRA